MIDEKKILKGIRKAVKAGWRLRTYDSVNEPARCGCALSVAAIGLGLASPYTADFVSAGRLLGLSSTEIWAFVASFDGWNNSVPFASKLRINCIDGHTDKVIT